MNEKIERLIEIKTKMEELKKEFDTIKKSLAPELDDAVTHNGYTISKYVKSTPKLKEWVGEYDMMLNYPDLVKWKFELWKFVEKHWDIAIDYVEFKDTDVVTFAKSKAK